MKKSLLVFLVLISILLRPKSSYCEDSILYVSCNKTGLFVENPFPGKAVTAKAKGKSMDGFIHGNCEVTYYIDEKLYCQYEGMAERGRLTGQGTMEYSSKEWPENEFKNCKYEGGWLNGRYDGQGTLSHLYPDKTRSIQSGSWKNGKMEGYGEVTFQNGDTYRGQFHEGKFHGKGTMKALKGTYSGDFIQHVFHGKGKFSFPDGRWYEGDWQNGTITGYGHYHTAAEDQIGYFVCNDYIGKEKPIWTTDTEKPILPKNEPVFSKVTILNQDYGKFYFDESGKKLIYENYNKGDKVIDLNYLTVSDTATTPNDHYSMLSRGKRFGVTNSYFEYKVFNTLNKELLTTISAKDDKNLFYSSNVLFNSFEKIASLTGDLLRVHFFSEALPVIANKNIQRSGNLFINHDDKLIGCISSSEKYDWGAIKTIDIYDSGNLELIGSLKVEFPNNQYRMSFLWDDGKLFIFKCTYALSNDIVGSHSFLKFFEYKNGSFSFLKDFPEQKDYQLERKNVLITNTEFTKQGERKHTSQLVDVQYKAHEYSVWDNNIVLIYYRQSQDDNFTPAKIFDRTTGELKFSFNLYNEIIQPNHDYSSFLACVKGSTDLENFEGRNKYLLYNMKDTLNGIATTIDINPEATQKELDRFARLPEIKKRWEQFMNDVQITDTMMFVVNSNNGKDFAEYINASSADEIRTWDKVNIFIGGVVKNTGIETYRVKVEGQVNFRITTSVFWVFNESQKENGPKLSTIFELKPGESKPFLFCTRDVDSGYYLKNSGIGQRRILDDPAYYIKTTEYKKNDTEEITRNVQDQKRTIDEFMANNGNLKATKKGFYNSFFGSTFSDLNIYCNFCPETTFTLYDSSNNKKDENKGKGTQFFVKGNETYFLKVFDNIYTIQTKEGITNFFINNDGTTKTEYLTK